MHRLEGFGRLLLAPDVLIRMPRLEGFAAAEATFGTGLHFANAQGSDVTKPDGCSALSDASNASRVLVFFNEAPAAASRSAVACGVGSTSRVVSGGARSLVDLSVTLNATITLEGPSHVWFGVGFNASTMKMAPDFDAWPSCAAQVVALVHVARLGAIGRLRVPADLHLAHVEGRAELRLVQEVEDFGRQLDILL